MQNQTTQTMQIDSLDHYMTLFGIRDEHLALLKEELGVDFFMKDNQLAVTGDSEKVEQARLVIKKIISMLEKGEMLDKPRIRYAIELAREGNIDRMDEILRDVIVITYKGKQIKAKTLGQRNYVQSMKNNSCVFAVGPAGTGKTYLAIAQAVVALKNKEIERIVLTRPAVEAGEKLGFLPGDLAQKIDPYLRPLYDALYDMIGAEAYQRLVERGAVEVAPLAYMRGRTLNDAFIILDEAQNTSSEQMKMFFLCIGVGSRMIITGDITQIDLSGIRKSGLVEALEVLKNVKGIGMVQLTHRDVVRHELVQAIVRAYERHQRGGRNN